MMTMVRSKKKRFRTHFLFVPLVLFLLACSPSVGSEAWCEKMNETAKGDWSTNDATAYAKNCLFK